MVAASCCNFSFVREAAGALHSVMIEAALCNNPAWIDDFIALSSRNPPHIAHKWHWTDSSRMRSTANLKRLTPRERVTLVGIIVDRCFSHCIARKRTAAIIANHAKCSMQKQGLTTGLIAPIHSLSHNTRTRLDVCEHLQKNARFIYVRRPSEPRCTALRCASAIAQPQKKKSTLLAPTRRAAGPGTNESRNPPP